MCRTIHPASLASLDSANRLSDNHPVPQYQNTPFLLQHRLHTTHVLKRAIYAVIRPAIDRRYRRYLSQQTLESARPTLVLGPRGFPLEKRRRWSVGDLSLPDTTILVQGTGTGWDVISIAVLRPRKIIATDLFAFEESWAPIRAYCKDRYGVEVEFHQCPLEHHSFLPDGSIDLCISDAVFEHCKDLPSVMRESFRLLRPGGVLYASYGPIWFSAGGDHFSGRGGLQHIFNHVLLEPEQYQAYFKTHLGETEEFQSGGRYVELDLFSKLTTSQYLDVFRNAGFEQDQLIIEISPDSLNFRRQFPDQFQHLLEKWRPRCTEDDFLIKGHLARLLKPR